MPSWLRPIAEANPVTVVVNAARGLVAGTPDTGTVIGAVAWIAVITLVFAPISMLVYRRHA